jgi:hypothetical protein
VLPQINGASAVVRMVAVRLGILILVGMQLFQIDYTVGRLKKGNGCDGAISACTLVLNVQTAFYILGSPC